VLDRLTDLRDMGVEPVILTHVIRIGYAQGAGYGHEAEYRTRLEDRAASLRAAGLEITIDIRASCAPTKDILQAAGEHPANLIVIGSCGQNMVHGLFLGSTAREVIRLRACLRRGFRRGGKRDSWGVGQQDDTPCDDDAEPTRTT
jgi:nucleotide-binding universal stress UspA family protein